VEGALGSFWREEAADVSKHSFKDVTPLRVTLLPRRSKSLVSDVESIVKTLDALRGLLSSDLDMIKSRSATASLMCGLASLPDELFKIIFLYVSVGPTGEVDLLAAMRLSLVCRRFREIALSSSELWTNITVVPASPLPSRFLPICLSRSKDRLLDISASFDIADPDSMRRFMRFFALVAPHCHRWRSFKLTYLGGFDSGVMEDSYSDSESSQLEGYVFDINEVHSLIATLPLPCLQELTIRYPGPSYTDDLKEERFFTSAYTFPNLNTVTFQDYIPLPDPSTTFPMVNSLDLRLINEKGRREIPLLLDLVAAFGSLTELALTLGGPSYWVTVPFSSQVPLTTIRTFRLKVFQETDFSEITHLMGTMHFPNCTEVEFHFTGPSGHLGDTIDFLGNDSDSDGEDYGILDFREHAGAAFGAEIFYPSAEHLRVLVSTPRSLDGFLKDAKIDLPLQKVPSLKSFVLWSDMNVHIENHITGEYPALRSIHMNTRYKHLKKWAGAVAEKLDQQGDWEAFEKFVVHKRGSAEYGAPESTIAKKIVRGWS